MEAKKKLRNLKRDGFAQYMKDSESKDVTERLRMHLGSELQSKKYETLFVSEDKIRVHKLSLYHVCSSVLFFLFVEKAINLRLSFAVVLSLFLYVE